MHDSITLTHQHVHYKTNSKKHMLLLPHPALPCLTSMNLATFIQFDLSVSLLHPCTVGYFHCIFALWIGAAQHLIVVVYLCAVESTPPPAGVKACKLMSGGKGHQGYINKLLPVPDI